MKIDLKKTVNTLSGTPYFVGKDKSLTVGAVLAEILATDQTGGKMKLYNLAQKAYNDDVLEVDSSDLSLIKNAASKSTAYNGNAVILGQIEEILEGIK